MNIGSERTDLGKMAEELEGDCADWSGDGRTLEGPNGPRRILAPRNPVDRRLGLKARRTGLLEGIRLLEDVSELEFETVVRPD